MDQFRRSSSEGGGGGKDQSSPPHINSIRESAFSRPILPTSSSLLLSSPPKPKPDTGAPNGVTGSGSAPLDPHPPPQAETPSSSSPSPSARGRYKECLRNHAASLGGHVVDGCGEFMPAGPAEPVTCAACGCHRSFHRREAEPGDGSASYRLQLMLPPALPRTLGFGGSGNTTTESSSEERANYNNYHGSGGELELGGKKKKKKRFRTKFTEEQKEKMMSFAERVEWRVQKKDETEMERFCRDIGVTRQVLKVWMHNNKHLVVRKQQPADILLGKAEDLQVEPEPEQLRLDKDVMS